MTAPGAFSSGDVLTAADMNDLPGGIVAIQRLGGATVTTTTLGITNQNILSGSDFDQIAGRRYGFFLTLCQVQNASSNISVRARVESPTGRVALAYFPVAPGNFYNYTAFGIYDATTTATGQSYYCDIDTNTGTCDIVTLDVSQECVLMIVDLGEY